MSISSASQHDLLRQTIQKEEQKLAPRNSTCKCAHNSQYGDASTCHCSICNCNILPCPCSSEECKCPSEESAINFTTMHLTKLNPFNCSIMACVLEEALDCLSCFGKHDLSGYEEEPDLKISIEEIINREEHCFLFDKERLIPLTKEHPGEEQRFVKVQKDREFIKNILRKTLTELQGTNQFIHLQEKVYYTLLNRNKKFKILNAVLQARKKLFAFDESAYAGKGQKLDFTEYEIDRLKYEIEDKTITGYAQQRFVDKWEKSRVEQNTLILTKKEEEYKAKQQRIYDTCGDEFIIHSNILKYLEEHNNKTQEQINHLSDNFEIEIDKLEGKLLNRSEILFQLENKIIDLTDVYDKRCQVIDDYLLYRGEVAKRKLQVIAATLIQAWWRGIYFRKKGQSLIQKLMGQTVTINKETSKKKKKRDSMTKGTKKKSIQKNT